MEETLKYLEYRSNIRSGDILVWSKRKLTTINDLFGWLVRLFTQSEYNHVGIAWVYNDRVFVLDAVIPYIRIIPLSNVVPFYIIPMDIELNKESEYFAFNLIGIGKYSISEAIKAYFDSNTLNEKWQCVEFVKEILRLNNINIEGRDVPSDFVLELQKLGKKLIFIE